jgi:carboxypeptidase Taq
VWVSYALLEQHFAKIGRLQEIEAIVEWDQAVNMPASAGPSRAEAMATLSVVWHELLADPRVGDWLQAAAQQSELDVWQRANVREMRRLFTRARAVPLPLVEALTVATKNSEHAWRQLRQNNDFAGYAPYLEDVVARTRESAAALAEALNLSPYDALLDAFEPDARANEIDASFASLRSFLPGFLQHVLAKQGSLEVREPLGPFSTAEQRELGLQLMVAVGFDARRGRLDTSHHAFCGGVPRDVRITTRYDEADFSSSLMGVLHEAGHGKYEQGLPEAWRHQPVGNPRGMVLHESQSLLQEMQICRGKEFLSFAAPKIRAAFPRSVAEQPEAFTLDNLSRWYTRVRRSLIRVEADEVTYSAHVLLRYDIERRLIDGTLRVRDLPEVWDQGMRELLGLTTLGDDRDGCMQDVHWPAGLFGYFPLYTLGAMVAAQLFATFQASHPEFATELSRGEFGTLNAWLLQHVWSRASSQSTRDILIGASGEPLNPAFYQAHLRTRYLA